MTLPADLTSPIAAPATGARRRFGAGALSLAGLWMIFMLGTIGIKWIPVTSIGPISIEMHNLATLITVAMLGVHLLTLRRYCLPPALLVLVALNIWLLGMVQIHNGKLFGGVILSLPTVLASIVMCNLRRDWLDDLKPVALLSSGLFWALMIYSASVAGINLIEDFLRYLTTQDRGYFIFQTLRPIFNAFTGPVDPDLEPIYAGANMNHMASAVYICFALCVAAIAQRPGRNWALYALATFLAVFLFIVFSSTVMMAMFFAFGVIAVMALRARQNVLVWLGAIACLAGAIFVLSPIIYQTILLIILADSSSVSTRGEQYSGALGVINDHPILGDGQHGFGGHSVHNLFLSSWMLSGLPAAVMVLAAYVISFQIMMQGARALLAETERPDMAYLMLLMPPLFIIRTNFAGGGGMPTGVENTALVLAILARYRLYSPLTKPERDHA